MSVKLRWKTNKSGDKSAYLDIYHNGDRNYEFLKIYQRKTDTSLKRKENKRLAEHIRAQRELDMQASDYNFVPSHKRKKNFTKYFEQYIEAYQKKDIRKAKHSLQKFQDYTQNAKLPFSKITVNLCEGFRDYLLSPKSGIQPGTCYDYWKQFKAVLRSAQRDNIITKNPSDNITIKGHASHKNRIAKNVLTKDELQAVAKAKCGNEEVKRAFLVACFTGIGLAEVRSLTWEAVVGDKFTYYRKKTNQQVIVKISQTLEKLLAKRGKPNEKIFKPLPSDTAVNKNLRYWVARAGIEKKITFYCGRHTFATILLINGANLKTVADLLGHTSTQHTLKYLNYVGSLKDEAINRLPNIEL